MPADPTPDHHAKRRERRRRVKRLRGRPLGDLNILPSFLTDTLAASLDVVQATAAELAPLLDGAGREVTTDAPPVMKPPNDPADRPLEADQGQTRPTRSSAERST